MSARILVLLDGLAETPGDVPTTLEATPTLALDAIARRGVVRRVATVPEGRDGPVVVATPGPDLAAGSRAVAARLREGTAVVVVRVDGLGPAAGPARRQALLQVDRDLLAPLAGLAMDHAALLAVCAVAPGGAGAATPGPAVLWGPGISARGPARVTEAATADGPIVDGPWTAA